MLQTVFAKQIAIFIEAPHLEKIIRTFSVLTLVNAITTTQIAILAGLKKFRDTAVINTIAGVITFFASAILSYYFGLNGALSALLLSCVVQMVVSHILIIKNKRTYTGNDKISSKDLRFILSYSFPVALQDSFYAVAHWLSTYLIIRLADYSEVGMLSAATIWQTIVVSVPIMLKNVMLSYFSSTLEHQSLMRKMLIVSFATSALPALFVILMSWYIASIYGATYVGIQYIIIVVCISAVFICLGEVFVYELLSNNKSWAVFFSRFFRDFLTLLIAYFILSSIQSGQALAYALVALAIHIVYLLFIYYLYRRYTIRNDRK